MREKYYPFVGGHTGARLNDQTNPERNLLSLLKTVIGDVKPLEQNNAKSNEVKLMAKSLHEVCEKFDITAETES